MSAESYNDCTGTFCPYCGSSDRLSYEEIPDHTITYTKAGEEHIIHGGPSRDYTCRNCDAQFLIGESCITGCDP